jgi:hypothetical protein
MATVARLLRGFVRNVRRVKARHILLAEVVLAILALAYIGLRNLWLSDLPLIARDLAIAVWADYKDGPERVPLPDDVDYLLSAVPPTDETYGAAVNSRWLFTQAIRILPYMEYERITGRVAAPELVVFAPRTRADGLHVAGWAQPILRWVFLNDRYATSPVGSDVRALYGTLVHELIHLQGGVFAQGYPEQFEAATQAATVEVLAAMCNYRDRWACYAFWGEIKGLALGSLAARLEPWAYELIGRLLFWDDKALAAYHKSRRYWADDPERLDYILRAYSLHPWEQIVLEGACGAPLYTGNAVLVEGDGKKPSQRKALWMPFDDTWYLMGRFWRAVACKLAYWHPGGGLYAERVDIAGGQGPKPNPTHIPNCLDR